MSVISHNLKSLRKKHQYTQEQFAEKLGIKRSLLGAYEEARAKPRLEILMKAAAIFAVSVDDLLGESPVDTPTSPSTTPPVTSASPSAPAGQPFKLVQKAQQPAYFAHRHDTRYLQTLPDMLLPTLPAAHTTYRAFEIAEELLAIAPGTLVVARREDNLPAVQSGQTYVVITREACMLRTVFNQIANSGTLRLQVPHTAQPETTLSLLGKEVELWEVMAYISPQQAAGHLPPANGQAMSLAQLTTMVLELQQEVARIKRGK